MRLAVRILGFEVLAVELARVEDGPPPVEEGPPFGFTGSAGLIADRAEPWPPEEVKHGG